MINQYGKIFFDCFHNFMLRRSLLPACPLFDGSIKKACLLCFAIQSKSTTTAIFHWLAGPFCLLKHSDPAVEICKNQQKDFLLAACLLASLC